MVEAFDSETKYLSFEVILPEGCDLQLAQIMEWPEPQRGDEGFTRLSDKA
jgi:hypothetical protein